ncbi:arylsulfatase [Microbacterium panaciterrae]|uniref:Arylsulfatase n=1 Tax=Microbacterium panaciterrae TaxID=985759 RepID=A0ABP8P4K3_9MICO
MGPNVLLIVADDMGFSDLGCYGGEIPTPNLDELARSGVRFSQFYNTARCSPSRASLLTGLHPHQTGIGVLTRPDLPHGYRGDLDPSTPTVAETLRDAGWDTALFGKWHLSAQTDAPSTSWPTRKGFDEFFGTLAGCSSYFDPQTLTRGESPATDAADDPDFYYTDAIAAEADRWLSQRGDDSRPFFLYAAFTAPHWPLHAKPEDIRAARGLFDDGWDRLREARLERLRTEGILSEGTRLSDRDPSQPAWDDVADPDWNLERMEVYAAQVIALDRAIGRILDRLRAQGELDDTLVLFLSDNGASAEELPIGTDETFVLKDRALREGTRDGSPVRFGNYPEITPGPESTYASYGIPWANLSNTPFRRYKRWVHEGGISTPLIVHWPQGRLAAGGVIDLPAQLVDILPTILDATGVPAEGAEGRSLLAALGGTAVAEAPLYWEHTGNAAIRVGQWKLVRAYPEPWELYDMVADRSELEDLADRHPDRRDALAAMWEDWAARVGALPWGPMVERYVAAGLAPAAAEE